MKRLRVYLESTDLSAANIAMQAILGDSNAFRLRRDITYQSGTQQRYYVSLPVSDGQASQIIAALSTLPSLRYFILSNDSNVNDAGVLQQYLRETNVPGAVSSIGSVYSVPQSDLAAAVPIVRVEQAVVYASDSGRADGVGTENDPVTPRSALTGTPRLATSEIIFLPGTCTITGNITTNVKANVVIHPAPGHDWTDTEFILKGKLTVATTGLTIEGFHLRGDPEYRAQNGGTNYVDITPGSGNIEVLAPNVVIRNNRIHDLYNFAMSSSCPGSHILENSTYNFGLAGPDRWHGHQLYLQNDGYDGTDNTKKIVRGNLFGSNNSGSIDGSKAGGNFGFHLYGTSNAVLAGVDVIDNVLAFSWFVCGGNNPVYDLLWQRNVHYRSRGRWGYSHLDVLGDGGTVELRDNHIRWQDQRPTFVVRPNQNVTIDGNTFSGSSYIMEVNPVEANLPTINNNAYYSTDSSTNFISYDNATRTFNQWKTLGFDANGTFQNGTPPDTVIIQELSIGNNVANIIVFNEIAQLNTVVADVSSLGLTNGQTLRISNPWNVAQYNEFTYNGSGTLSLPMTGWSWGQMLGSDAPEPTVLLDKKFMAFRLEALT